MAKNTEYLFFADELKNIEQWVAHLTKFVVRIDLQQRFTFGKELGRGNFAKVNECFMKNDPSTLYALKSINKSILKKEKYHAVSSPILASYIERFLPFLNI